MSERTECDKLVDYVRSKLGRLSIHPFISGGFSPRFPKPPGYEEGIPDYIIPRLMLYIEMKDVNPGKVKKHEEKQAKIHEELRSLGMHVHRCEGYLEAKKVFDFYYNLSLKEYPEPELNIPD